MTDAAARLCLEDALRRHEAAIVEAWEVEASRQRHSGAFHPHGSVADRIRELAQNAVSRIGGRGGSPVSPTAAPSAGVSEHDVLDAIHAVQLGERVVAETLRPRMSVSDAEWLVIRHRINRAFRELALETSSAECEACHCHQKEELATLSKLEDGLRQAFQKRP